MFNEVIVSACFNVGCLTQVSNLQLSAYRVNAQTNRPLERQVGYNEHIHFWKNVYQDLRFLALHKIQYVYNL